MTNVRPSHIGHSTSLRKILTVDGSNAQSITGSSISMKTSNASISGAFSAISLLELVTSNSPIVARIDIVNYDKTIPMGSGPALLQTTNG